MVPRTGDLIWFVQEVNQLCRFLATRVSVYHLPERDGSLAGADEEADDTEAELKRNGITTRSYPVTNSIS